MKNKKSVFRIITDWENLSGDEFIRPDLVYNRLDLLYKNNVFLIESRWKGTRKYFFMHVGGTAELGIWLYHFYKDELDALYEFIFVNFHLLFGLPEEE